MNKTQRQILIATAAQFFSSLVIIHYLVNFPLAIVAAMAIDFWLFRSLLTNKGARNVLLRLIRPALLLALVYSYYFTNAAVTGTRLLSFLVVTTSAIAWHGVLCNAELSAKKHDWIWSAETAVLIFISTNIASLMIANWSLPLALVLGIYLVLNVLVALWWLARLAKNVNFLALIWGLAAGELLWISNHWLIFYQLPLLNLLISQIALLITTLAYSWGGIYSHYKDQKLSRRIVFEYLLVLLIVVAVLLVLTRWRVF